MADMANNLALVTGAEVMRSLGHIPVESFMKSTLRMLDYSVEDSCGDRDLAIAAMSGFENHPSFKYLRGQE